MIQRYQMTGEGARGTAGRATVARTMGGHVPQRLQPRPGPELVPDFRQMLTSSAI